MILEGYNEFLDKLFLKLEEIGIDVSEYEMDHMAYQASSDEDYDRLKPEFLKIGEIISENIVGGRRVGVFKLKNQLTYKDYKISAIELLAPQQGQKCLSAFQHAEFVIDESFESFIKRHPGVSWDINSINRDLYPRLKLQLSEGVTVKFHLMSILDMG